MKIPIVLTVLCLGFSAFSQSVTFRQTDQKVKVYKGAQVEIVADTAYIISNDRALLLNEKLTELESTRKLNRDIFEEHKQLKSKVLEIEKLVGNLLQKLQKENRDIEFDLADILNQLDASLITLRQNNNELAQHNRDLKTQINTLQSTIKVLKKEIRGIWWNGVLDKVVVGVASLTIGFILGSF